MVPEASLMVPGAFFMVPGPLSPGPKEILQPHHVIKIFV